MDKNGNHIQQCVSPPNPVLSEKVTPTQDSSGSESGEEVSTPTRADRTNEDGMDYTLSQTVRGEYNSPDFSTMSSCSTSSVLNLSR